MTDKICNKCPDKGLQPIENFGIRSSTADGYNPTCKSCINAYQKENSRKKKLVISTAESKVIENQLNGLHKVTDTLNIVKEQEKVDEALLTLMRPFYYYLLTLQEDAENRLITQVPPHVFCQTFFPSMPHAGLELFYTYAERNNNAYSWKKTVGTLKEMIDEYSMLVAISSLIKEPSVHLMAKDLSNLRETTLKIERSLQDFLAS